MSQRAPSPGRIALIVAHAATFGDKSACSKFGINPRTLFRYKKRADGDVAMSDKVNETVEKVRVAWIDRAKETRSKLLSRVEDLAQLSDNLHDVTGAYKIVNDGILAEQVVNEGEDNGGRTGAGNGLEGAREADPQAEVPGNVSH